MASASGIEIRVLEEDALAYPADALVLKYAQRFYGLDALVAKRIGAVAEQFPLPGAYRRFSGPTGVASGAVLFIGVEELHAFSYPEIRTFASRALSAAASALPHAREMCLTLHGTGYGLDEVACFEAQVAGLLDAIGTGEVPAGLRIVSFLEIDSGRADRMRRALGAVLGSDTTVAVGGGSGLAQTPRANRLRERATHRLDQEHVFVAMPFDPALTDRFHYGVSRAVHACGLLCERVDRQAYTGDVLERLKNQIRTARLVVADLTGSNANVFLEVGFAWGNGVPTVLVCPQGTELSFDVRGQRCIFFSSIQDLEAKLKSELDALLRLPR